MSTAGEQVRVNIKTKVNQGMISHRGEGDAREMVIRSVAAVDDTVLNRILYTANELNESMDTLDRTPAPLGHPITANGDFLSARDVEAINGFYFGAYNENPRRDGNRIIVDKVINVKRAQENEMGRRVLDAVNRGDPIHTSTGLMCTIEDCDEERADFVARNILFDHDAILLDEPGAATPEDGVGMMVNSAGVKIEAMNVSLDEDFDREVEWAIESIARAVERKEERESIAPIVQRIKSALMGALGLTTRETETNSNEVQDMTEVTKEQFDGLSSQVNSLAETLDTLDFAGALKEALDPLTEQVEGIVNADKAKADAKHTGLVERVVNQNLLPEDVAKATPEAALQAMLTNAGNNLAAPILGGFSGRASKSTYELPEE